MQNHQFVKNLRDQLIAKIREMHPDYTINADNDYSVERESSAYIVAFNKAETYMTGDTSLAPVAIRIRISDHGGSWKYATQARIELDSDKELPSNIEEIIAEFEVEQKASYIKGVQQDLAKGYQVTWSKMNLFNLLNK